VPVNLVVQGTSYAYPVQGDQNWGTGATDWAEAVTEAIGSVPANGTWASPVGITAAGGIPFSSVAYQNNIFVNGAGGTSGAPGPVVVTATNPVALPNAANQQLTIICTDSTNTVTLNSGTGLMLSGDAWVGSQGSVLQLLAVTAALWLEVGRSQL